MRSMLVPAALSHRTLCGLLAALMAAGPALPIAAQVASPAAPSTSAGARYVVRGACVVVVVRPAQLFSSPLMEMFPTEVMQAASIKETGLDPLDLQQVVVSVAPPLGGPPAFAVYGEFSRPAAIKLPPGLLAKTEEAELGGRSYRRSLDSLNEPSIYAPTDESLLVTPEANLKQFVGGEAQAPSGAAANFAAEAANADLFAAVDIVPLRPFIAMGLAQAQLPPEAASLRGLPNLVKSIEFRLNLSGAGPTELVAVANDAAAAAEVVQMVDGFKQIVRDKADAEIARLAASDDPVEQALGRYQRRMQTKWNDAMQLAVEGNRLTIFHVDPAQPGAESTLVMVAVVGVLVALLLPAVQAAREAARRNASMNNLKQISLGMLNYESVKRSFPPRSNIDGAGKPLLSWRVHLLPYMEQQALYEKFHLDEPWDSPHNRTLIPLMPEFYAEPSAPIDPSSGKTCYLAAVGPDFAFTPQGTVTGNGLRGRSFREISDGPSNTIMVVQAGADAAVEWTRPADFEWAEINPLTPLASSPHPGIFLAAFCDGHSRAISTSIDPDVLRGMLTVAGEEAIPSQ